MWLRCSPGAAWMWRGCSRDARGGLNWYHRCAGDQLSPLARLRSMTMRAQVMLMQATVLSPLSIPLLYHSTFGVDSTFVPLAMAGAYCH